MQELITAYKSHIKSKRYYIFVIAEFSNESGSAAATGYMPYQQRYGFVTMKSEDLVRTIAHELGHGAFGLKHTFEPEYSIDDRYNNLMGYGKGDTARLFKFQWDIAHNSKAGEDEFEDAEEVMYSSDGHFYTVRLIALKMGINWERAKELAVEAEAPDSKVNAPWDMEERYTWIKSGLQQEFHALTGRKHGIELALTTYAIEKTHKNAESNSRKYLLHRFGDCFGHITMSSTKESDFNTNINLQNYVNAVDGLWNDYVVPKIKTVPSNYEVVVDLVSGAGDAPMMSGSIEIKKQISLLKIFFDGSHLLTTLSLDETKKELIEQLLVSYNINSNKSLSHNKFLRIDLINELTKKLPKAIQNDYSMYGNNLGFTLGHLWDSKVAKQHADDIGRRKELYFYYVNKLIDLLSVKEDIINFNKEEIILSMKKIVNIVFKDGSVNSRLDGVFAFECLYSKNKNASFYEFAIPIKYNSQDMNITEQAVNAFNDFKEDAEKQRDVLLSYLAQRLIIDKIEWKYERTSTTLDRNNYPQYVKVPNLIEEGKCYVVINEVNKFIQFKLNKK